MGLVYPTEARTMCTSWLCIWSLSLRWISRCDLSLHPKHSACDPVRLKQIANLQCVAIRAVSSPQRAQLNWQLSLFLYKKQVISKSSMICCHMIKSSLLLNWLNVTAMPGLSEDVLFFNKSSRSFLLSNIHQDYVAPISICIWVFIYLVSTFYFYLFYFILFWSAPFKTRSMPHVCWIVLSALI